MTLIQRNSARVVPWNSILFCSRKYSRGGTSFLSFFSLLFPLVHARETFPLAERVFQPGKNVSFYQRIGGRAEGAAGSRGWLCKIHSTIRQARETNVHFYTYVRREVSTDSCYTDSRNAKKDRSSTAGESTRKYRFHHVTFVIDSKDLLEVSSRFRFRLDEGSRLPLMTGKMGGVSVRLVH